MNALTESALRLLVLPLLLFSACDLQLPREEEPFDQSHLYNHTITVEPGWSGHSNHLVSSLNEALRRAEPGDRIILPAGVFRECPTLSKPVTLVGAGSAETVIECNRGRATVVVSANDVTLEGLHLRGGRPGLQVGPVLNLRLHSILISGSVGSGILVNGGAVSAENLHVIGVLRGAGLKFGQLGDGITLEPGSVWNQLDGRISGCQQNGFYVRDSALNLVNVEIDHNDNLGISLQQGPESRLDRVHVHHNRSMGIFVANRKLSLLDSLVTHNPYGMLTSPESTLLVERNRFENNGEGLSMVGGKGTIQHNLFIGQLDGGLSVQSIREETLIAHNTLIDNVRHGIHLSYARFVTVEHNQVSGTLLSDDPAFGKTLGDGISLLDSQGIIRYNRVSGSEGAGIYGQYSAGLVEKNELIGNLEGGLFLTDNFDNSWIATDNTMKDNVGGGIVMRNSEITADGNTISGSRLSTKYLVGDGIVLLERVGRAMLTNNLVENSAGNGIGIYQSSSVTLSGNMLRNNKRYGIFNGCNPDVTLTLENNSFQNNMFGDQNPCN